MGQMAHADMKFEGTMAWSAYNLGTTGYNQAVAIGKVLKDNYDVNLRVVPGKNDVSRLMPLIKGRVQYSANGVATYFAQEGVFQFAQPQWGPLPLRIVMMSYGDSNQALAVAADAGVRTYADLRGKRVPYVRGAPAINIPTEAFLACGGQKEYNAKYRQDNKEKIKADRAKYRQDNKEKIKADKAKYYQDNKEDISIQKSKYRQDNKEKIKEYHAKHYQDNKEYKTNYKYWCNTSPIGILSRAYFHELNKHNEN